MSTEKQAAPAVVRATRLLDTLAAASAPLTFTDLTRELGLPKSTLHGLCATLLDLQLIKRVDNGFALGPHVLRWAHAFVSSIDITQEFFAAWDDMRVLPHESITLSILDGTDVVYIACRNGDRPMGLTFRTGMHLPAAYAATGKAMLSTLPDDVVRDLFHDAWPPRMTRHGPADVDALLDELHVIRKTGYSTDVEGVCEGMHCFGAAVFDANGQQAVAGVAVSFLAHEVNDAARAQAGDAIRSLANRLSQRLGSRRSV